VSGLGDRPVFLHIDYEKYKDRYMGKSKDGVRFTHSRMVPSNYSF